MALRFAIYSLSGALNGAVLSLVLALPALNITWELSIPALMAVGGTAGFLGGVLAMADTLGPFGRGSGQWLGAAVGAAAGVGFLGYDAISKHNLQVFDIGEYMLVVGQVVYTAFVGFIAGRYAERSARPAVAKQCRRVTPTA